jgi:prepilin-type N-terminal cleavage/methylation domain-containing protein
MDVSCHYPNVAFSMQNKTFGLSLIEILVALSIIAILAAILVPRLLDVREKATETTAEEQMRALNKVYVQWRDLGGLTGSSTGGQVIYFLNQTATSTTATRCSGTFCGSCSDTSGSFGSITISLAGVNVSSSATLSTSDFTSKDLDGFWVDSEGNCFFKLDFYYWPVTFNATNAPHFSLGTKVRLSS